MASASAASVGVAGARPGATPASGLVDRTGRPFGMAVAPARLLAPSGHPVGAGPSPVTVARRLQEMMCRDGSPLFPDAPDPELLARATTFPDTAPAWSVAVGGRALGTALAAVDMGALPDVHVVDLAHAHARMIAHHEARLATTLAELADRTIFNRCTNRAERPHESFRAAAEEIGLALTWTQGYADHRVAAAVELAQDLPATMAALNDGVIDTYKARVIADETRTLPNPRLRHDVEHQALQVAARKTGPQLRAHLKRRVLAADPETAEKRREAARRGRCVRKPRPAADGMGSMTVFGPVEDLAAFYTAVDSAARARKEAATPDHPDHDTSLEALRFDVLADLGWSALDATHLGCCNPSCDGISQRTATHHRRAASIGVTVPAATLIRRQHDCACATPEHDTTSTPSQPAGFASNAPSELHGYGPITANAARAVAAAGTWRRLLTDPVTGGLVDYGTTRYTPPQDLADFVIARDRTCRWLTCTHPAANCDLDHTIAFTGHDNGGHTSADDLGPFHRRHHNAKTHHGFTIEQPEAGRFVITTPTGKIYEVDPEVLCPISAPPAHGLPESAHQITAHGPNDDEPDEPPF